MLLVESLDISSLDSSVECLALTSDGNIWSGGLYLLCWKERNCVFKLQKGRSSFECLSVSEEGLLWASYTNGRMLLVENFSVVAEVSKNSRIMSLVAMSGNRCFSGSGQGVIKEWVWDGKSLVNTTTFFSDEVDGGCFLQKDGRNQIWSIGREYIQCWVNNKSVKSINTNFVYEITVEDDIGVDKSSWPYTDFCSLRTDRIAVGDFVFVGRGRKIFCWTLEGKFVHQWEAHEDIIGVLAVGKDGEDDILWSGSLTTIQAWKGPWDNPFCSTDLVLDSMCTALAVSPNGSVWASSGGKLLMVKWDESGSKI